MQRGRAGAVGAMLAIAVGVAAPWASAQGPAPQLQKQPMPVQRGQTPEQEIRCNRLEEMKVELALLGDRVTFPYTIAATTRNDILELYGFVPNSKVRQRALEVARRSTYLPVFDTVGFKNNQNLQPSPRPMSVLLREGAELLQKELDETAKHVSLGAGPNGVIVLTGRIDSLENKLEVSRIFRQLPGCIAVDNKLTVEPVVRGGQRMVQVTRDGSLFVPVAALRLEQAPVAAPPPTLLLTKSQDEKKVESRLPTPVATKQPSAPPQPMPEVKVGHNADPFAPSKLPVKWGRPVTNWEAQANELEKMQSPPIPAQPQIARQPAMMPTPAAMQSSYQQSTIPIPVQVTKRPEEPKNTLPSTAASKTSRAIANSRPSFAETRPAQAPVMPWKHPGGNEESELKNAEATMDSQAPAKSLLSLHPSRRWPPAYVTGPPSGQGRPGVIVFDDDPPPSPKPAVSTAPMARPIVPLDLQRLIRKVCGPEASDVVVTTQRDGTVLVRVKVANHSVEDRLSRKILDLPEMTSPRVRLFMEVGP